MQYSPTVSTLLRLLLLYFTSQILSLHAIWYYQPVLPELASDRETIFAHCLVPVKWIKKVTIPIPSMQHPLQAQLSLSMPVHILHKSRGDAFHLVDQSCNFLLWAWIMRFLCIASFPSLQYYWWNLYCMEISLCTRRYYDYNPYNTL